MRRIWLAWLAFLTWLGLRKPKGLRKVPPEALRPIPADDVTLDRALKALKPIPEEEIATNPAFQGTPKKLRKGERYDARSGATIYAHSITMTSYVGSAQEEQDFKMAQGRPMEVRKVTGPKTCERCLGWGFITDPEKKCDQCKGKGSR